MKRSSRRLLLLNRGLRARRKSGREAPGMKAARLRRAAIATRSGMQRYPREIYASIREGRRLDALIAPCAEAGGFEHLELGALWIGHATVLLRIGGLTIVTDPVF